MVRYPSLIKKLIDQFARLPGIGPKSAERIVFSLLTIPPPELKEFSAALAQLPQTIIRCQQCQNFSESNPCEICGNKKRNQGVICVVAKPQDLAALEKSGDYEGVYHILGGVIDPLSGVTPDQLSIKALIGRLKNQRVHEIILALSPDMPGETTMLYLTKLLKQHPVAKITRLARGLPVGGDLEYADEVTLGSALKNRRDA